LRADGPHPEGEPARVTQPGPGEEADDTVRASLVTAGIRVPSPPAPGGEEGGKGDTQADRSIPKMRHHRKPSPTYGGACTYHSDAIDVRLPETSIESHSGQCKISGTTCPRGGSREATGLSVTPAKGERPRGWDPAASREGPMPPSGLAQSPHTIWR
jgi:hypothetical protein